MKTNIVLCKTPAKFSAVNDYMILYRLYRVRLLSGEEIDKQAEAYNQHMLYNMRSVWSLEYMLVKEVNGIQTNPVEWLVLGWGESAENAARYAADDYLRAQSLDPLHQTIIDYYEKLAAQTKIVTDLTAKKKQLIEEYKYKYIAALKKRRLFSKAQRNETDPAVIEPLKKQFLAEFQKEDQLLEMQLAEAKQYHDFLRE